MIYLENFQPNLDKRHVYPYSVISPKQLEHIEFAPITIFYGNNGSGKSTLLNVIADRIGIHNKTLGNTNEYFQSYVHKCTYSKYGYLPDGSSFFRSEDLMEGIVSRRKKYARVTAEAQSMFERLMPANNEFSEAHQVRFRRSLSDPDTLTGEDRFLLSNTTDYAKAMSARREMAEFQSNGETALKYLEEMLNPDTLYILDEPENSMAPVYQQELANRIELLAYRLNSQFIIATHSPFLLSIRGARIYNLDTTPAQTCEWYELENMQIYYQLFQRFADRFQTKSHPEG